MLYFHLTCHKPHGKKKFMIFIQLKIDMRIFLDWYEIQTLNHEKNSSSRKKIVAF